MGGGRHVPAPAPRGRAAVRARAPDREAQPMNAAAEFEWTDLERALRVHVAALAAAPRPPGTSEHERARAYIEQHLRQAGFTVEAVECESVLASPGVNLLTAPLPDRADLPLLVIGAHYDSTPTTPGADDNARAVAALLE